MRQTKRRNPRSSEIDLDVATFFREMLTGKYRAISAPTYRDIEEWARARRAVQ